MDLSFIGGEDYDEDSATVEMQFNDKDQPDKISIITDENDGVCDVVIY